MSESRTDSVPDTASDKPEKYLLRYSNELLTVVEDMKYKRDEIHKQVLNETKEKDRLRDDIKVLTDKLAEMNEGLCKKMIVRQKLDQTIKEAEEAFTGLVHGSVNIFEYIKALTDAVLPKVKAWEGKEDTEPEIIFKKVKSHRRARQK